jgi:hypothetical protein
MRIDKLQADELMVNVFKCALALADHLGDHPNLILIDKARGEQGPIEVGDPVLHDVAARLLLDLCKLGRGAGLDR